MSASVERVLHLDGLAFDPVSGVLDIGGRTTTLRPRTAAVFAHLLRRTGQVVTKDELLAVVWSDVVVTEDSLVQCVKEIRRALGDTGRDWIRTLPRQGYAMVGQTPASTREARAASAAASARSPRWWTLPVLWMRLALVGALAIAVAWLVMRPSPTTSGPPSMSVVVLPLQITGGDSRQDYVADALTDDITVDVSRITGSFVIGRSTAARYRGRAVDARDVGRELGVRYVLEGRLDRRGDDVQLAMQLVEASSGRAVWNERFNGRLGDLASLHRQVTGTVARSLQLRMVEVDGARAVERGSQGAAAADLALQASWYIRRHTGEDIATARELLQFAVEQDPQSVLAWTLLAQTYAHDVALRRNSLRGASRDETLRLGLEAAERAYMLDPSHTGAIGARARILSYLGRTDESLQMLEKLLSLNPNDAAAWFMRSYTYVTLGSQEEAIRAGLEAVRISPRDHELAGFYVVLAAANLYLGRDDQALHWASKSALEHPKFSIAHSWIASAAALGGDTAMAKTALAEFRRLQPDYTIASLRGERLCANDVCRAQRERYYEGLAKAGLAQ